MAAILTKNLQANLNPPHAVYNVTLRLRKRNVTLYYYFKFMKYLTQLSEVEIPNV